MKKWALLVDVALCSNCRNCHLACKDEYVGNDFPGYSAAQPLHGHAWIDIEEKERGAFPMVDVAYLPKMCMHCDDAPCVRAGAGAVAKRPDGIVLIDPVKAKGRHDIVASCPYGAIHWNQESQLPQHWTFDAHLLDGSWKEPRATQVCPTGALKALRVDDAELAAVATEGGYAALKPELKTKPRVLYRNLHRFEKAFVGGTVLRRVEGVLDCLEGAVALLLNDGKEIGSATSDAFGDFKIDGADPGSGVHEVRITAPGFRPAVRTATLGESIYLGEIELEDV
jgi:Fe-S-cluster-containing dehydrogenase component